MNSIALRKIRKECLNYLHDEYSPKDLFFFFVDKHISKIYESGSLQD